MESEKGPKMSNGANYKSKGRNKGNLDKEKTTLSKHKRIEKIDRKKNENNERRKQKYI